MDIPYSFYTDTYHGTLNEIIFNRELPRALADFNQLTFNRVEPTDTTEVFWMAVCELIELNSNLNNTASGLLSSMSDGVTRVTFTGSGSGSGSSGEITYTKIGILRRWLSAYKDLLYRGSRL